MKRKEYILSLVMLASLFFIFGLVSWVNSILVPYFKVACDLKTGFQSYLVTFAFYIAYLVMTIPAALLLNRTGLKKGGVIGLLILALGAMLFWPAALTRTYGLFLLALFTMGTALAILQTVANPFVTIIGPEESAARRISVMGVCNKFAGIIAPLVFAALVIRPQDKATMDLIGQGSLAGQAKEAALDELVRGVIPPYIVLAILLVVFAFVFRYSALPDINPGRDNLSSSEGTDRKSIFSYPYLILGVVALFAHVGSQQITISTIISYAQSLGMDLDAAKLFPSYTLGCILVGYLIGIITIPKYLSQQTALLICTITGLVLSILVLAFPPRASIWFLVLLGIPNSLIYAGIWPLAIKGLGRWTNLGSSLLVMALCGNAIMSLLYGLEADRLGEHAAYWLLIPCFVYMIFYAVYGHKIRKDTI
ncbi:MAG: sugar MFS transporter [Bacteroidales bacterium]|nr:sugar MFS transporter [Bacteroidales bacterium]